MDATLPDVPPLRVGVKRGGLPRVIVIALVGVVAIIVTWFSPLGSQKRNLLAAERHANLIRPLMQADARFQKAKIGTYTGSGGCLWVGGVVNSKEDGEALRIWVASTKPTVRTHFMVFLLNPEADSNGYIRLADVPPGDF